MSAVKRSSGTARGSRYLLTTSYCGAVLGMSPRLDISSPNRVATSGLRGSTSDAVTMVIDI